jgi:hypothetical protein
MAYSDVVLADSPLAYWRFESGELADSSGNGRSLGVLRGAPQPAASLLAAHPTANSMNFLGNSTLSVASDAWMVPSSFTVECWFAMTSTAQQMLMARDNLAGGTARAWNLIYEGGIMFRVWNSTGAAFFAVTAPGDSYIDGEPHHAVGTFDATTNTARLYVDGQLIGGTGVGSAASVGTSQPITIGGSNHTSVFTYFTGRLDEAAFYGTALSAERIALHYQEGALASPPPPPTVEPGVPTLLNQITTGTGAFADPQIVSLAFTPTAGSTLLYSHAARYSTSAVPWVQNIAGCGATWTRVERAGWSSNPHEELWQGRGCDGTPGPLVVDSLISGTQGVIVSEWANLPPLALSSFSFSNSIAEGSNTPSLLATAGDLVYCAYTVATVVATTPIVDVPDPFTALTPYLAGTGASNAYNHQAAYRLVTRAGMHRRSWSNPGNVATAITAVFSTGATPAEADSADIRIAADKSTTAGLYKGRTTAAADAGSVA